MIPYHMYHFRTKQKISDLTESQYCDIIDLYNNHREEGSVKYEVNIKHVRREAAWWRDVACVMHIHRELEIVYVTEGVLDISLSGKTIRLTAGTMLYIEPLEPHSFISKESNMCCIIEYPPTLYQDFWTHLQQHTTENRIIEVSDAVRAYLHYLLPSPSVLRSDHAERLERNENYMRIIAHVIGYEFMTRCIWTHQPHMYDDTFIEALIYISNNLKNKLSLTAISQHVGIAPETLCRKFAQFSSMSPNEYINYMRVCLAADDLRDGMTIAEAAMNNGFGSISNFNRSFKKVTSMTPTEYRRNTSEQSNSLWNGMVRF